MKLAQAKDAWSLVLRTHSWFKFRQSGQAYHEKLLEYADRAGEGAGR